MAGTTPAELDQLLTAARDALTDSMVERLASTSGAALEIVDRLSDPDTLDAIIDLYEHNIGPKNGARVVARAWSNPQYKARLLENATPVIAELGYSGAQAYSLLGTAPVQGHISGIVDVPNVCATIWIPTEIFDFDIMPSADGPTIAVDSPEVPTALWKG